MKNINKTKKKILDALGDLKEYEVSYAEEVVHSKIFKAKDRDELEEKFNNGELEFDDTDIIDGDMVENSLEINEVE